MARERLSGFCLKMRRTRKTKELAKLYFYLSTAEEEWTGGGGDPMGATAGSIERRRRYVSFLFSKGS